jgi:hypothetical protein
VHAHVCTGGGGLHTTGSSSTSFDALCFWFSFKRSNLCPAQGWARDQQSLRTWWSGEYAANPLLTVSGPVNYEATLKPIADPEFIISGCPIPDSEDDRGNGKCLYLCVQLE